MKSIIVVIAGALLLGGCALPDHMDKPTANYSKERKQDLTKCVSGFLQQDVSPVDSLNICSSIYSKWSPTTTGQVSDGQK